MEFSDDGSLVVNGCRIASAEDADREINRLQGLDPEHFGGEKVKAEYMQNAFDALRYYTNCDNAAAGESR